jgi:coproporphyrinogen III oxidase
LLICRFVILIIIQHRGERRGLGGIFFDDMNDYDQEMLLAFSTGASKLCSSNFLIYIFSEGYALN